MPRSSAKTGTTIFAYFYLVSSVLSLVQIVLFLYLIICIKISYSGEDPAVKFLTIGAIIPIITLPFASVLVHGVRRKNPNCLIAFIVFGVFKILFTVTISLFLTINHETCGKIFFEEFCDPLLLLTPLILCVVFGGILVMIGFAAREYRKERQLQPNSIYDSLTTHPTYALTPTEKL